MKQLALINPENVTEIEVKSYNTREAARAIVLDENSLIALLYVASEKYYKLPGGGLEGRETPEEALYRECREEIGSEITLIKDVGMITEYRRIFNLKQISYCYLAKLKGPKGTPHYTEEEITNGFTIEWLTIDEALKNLSENQATSVEGRDYIVPRDLAFLNKTKEVFKLNV